jgi:spore germination protein
VANTASATSGATRRYLPSIADTPTNEPLNASAALAKTGKQMSLYGWITPWNAASGTSDIYNAASAFWLTVNDDGIGVTQKADWKVWDQYKASHILSETYLTVSGNPNATYITLSNVDAQNQHISALLNAVSAHGFDGIDIDYEGLGSANRDAFTAFVRNLTTVFHQANKKVAITLEARIANQVPMDWHNVGLLSDEVRIMAYDYHSHSTATPGPISPLAWVAEIAAYAADQIDAKKIVMGLGNYGYDWTEPANVGDSWQGTGISYDQAVNLSATNKSPVVHKTGIDERGYDIGTIPSFSYTDADQHLHHVWFEDATSLQEKVNILATYRVKGVMFWSVGAGDPALWQPQA